jgi:3-deoxy-D-manno-octulosonate 8-phosphate phosphatase (KDO 8-P phosphatase)
MKIYKKNFIPKTFVIDVDGVFTDGKFYYTEQGKVMKQFGPEDNDALALLDGKIEIHCVTGDKRGFAITKKRINDDMGIKLSLVSTFERIEWIREFYDPQKTIYMGDGIFDPLVFKEVGYSIAPQNAFYKTKTYADFITNAKGGEGAVAEASLHILEMFFQIKFDIHSFKLSKGSGAWKSP